MLIFVTSSLDKPLELDTKSDIDSFDISKTFIDIYPTQT